MHKVKQYVKQVNRTHRGLGKLYGMALVATKAKKCMITIAPAGCGKSTVTNALRNLDWIETRIYDSVTRGALRFIAKELSGFNGLVVIDDMGKIDTQYSRMATTTTFAELCYSHFIRKLTMTLNINVEDFYGSAILNIQPSVFSGLIEGAEWEAVIRDKTLRYYHLHRPIKSCEEPIRVKPEKGIPINQVSFPNRRSKMYRLLEAIGRIQWSRARVHEHLTDLLRACAALDRRTRIGVQDYHLLYYLMKPMVAERFLVDKSGFELGRWFNSNAFCILVELASYPELTPRHIADDYHVAPSTVNRLLSTVTEYCFLKSNSPEAVIPTKFGMKVLEVIGAYEP